MPHTLAAVLAVVVLTYRAPVTMLRRCLDAVIASGDADEIVVVDNGGSVDAGALPAGTASGGSDIVLDTSPENLGYAGGMNRGLRRALADGAEVVAVLNDDTVVTPGWLTGLAARLRDGDRVGAAQPKLVLLDGESPDRDPPRLQSAGVRLRGDGAAIDAGYGDVDTGQYDGVTTIEIFSGAAVAFTNEFLADIGGFDERFFAYYEDVDLALRGRARGWTYALAPDITVHHEMSATTATMSDQRRYWQERNRLWCLFLHGGPLAIARGLLLALARLAKVRNRAQARAIADGIAGAPRRIRERRHPRHFEVVA